MRDAAAAIDLSRTARWRSALTTGAALGLAVGSKYTAAIAVVAVVVAVLQTASPWRRRLLLLIAAGCAAVAAAFVVTPYSFIRFHDLLTAMRYEEVHTHGHHYGFSLPARGWQYHKYIYQIFAAWPFSLGLPFYLSAIAGTGVWLLRGSREKWMLVAFAVCFFGVTGHWTFTPLRYYMPVIILAPLCAAWGLDALLGASGRFPRRAGVLVTAGVLAYTAVFAFQTTDRYRHDTRVEASRWLDEHIAQGSRIGYCGWSRYMAVSEDKRKFSIVKVDEYHLLDEFLGPDCDFLEISSLLYNRAYRHGTPLAELYDELRYDNPVFLRVARFESHFLNKSFYMKLDPMFEGYFVSPTIEFYELTPRRG